MDDEIIENTENYLIDFVNNYAEIVLKTYLNKKNEYVILWKYDYLPENKYVVGEIRLKDKKEFKRILNFLKKNTKNYSYGKFLYDFSLILVNNNPFKKEITYEKNLNNEDMKITRYKNDFVIIDFVDFLVDEVEK